MPKKSTVPEISGCHESHIGLWIETLGCELAQVRLVLLAITLLKY